MKTTTLTILFLLNLIIGFSQSKPVTVLISLTPPYSPFLNEYASSGTNHLQVTLIVNDSRMINYPVKLQLFIERPGTGIVMRTAEYAAIPPILLNGGATEVLSGASLTQYFQAQNNVFSGFDQSQYLQTGRIPDGQYRIGFQVVDARRSEVKLSDLVFSQPGWFLLNDPPQLNLPRNNVTERVNDPQSIKLEWFPRHLGSMNSAFATSYQVELFALRVPGMDPNQVALSLPPVFTAVTNQNRYTLSQDKYLLEPGVEYAWRVKAMAGDGFTLFQNKGYSEVFSFVYGQQCPVPQNTDAEVQGYEKATISWGTDPLPTSWEVRFRKQGQEGAVWHSRESFTGETEIANVLSAGTAYEYQVRAKCVNNRSDYSQLKTFTTGELPPPVNFDCGKEDTTGQVTNFTPKLQLNPGDIIYNGEFPVKLTAVEGGSGTFKGKGRMRVPMLANIQINMQFTGLKVNEENQVFGGEMVSVYNEDSPFFIEDLSDYFGEGDQIGNVITGQDSAAIILDYVVGDPNDIDVTIDGNTVTVSGSGGSTTVTIDDGGSGTTIVDSDGNIYAVDGDGNVTTVGTSGGNVSTGDYNNTLGGYNKLDNELVVTFANNGTWAFDERKPAYEGSLFDGEYEKIGDYYVPWKFVPLGKSDKITASITAGSIEDPSKLKFLTPTGTEFLSEYKDGQYFIEVIGGKERDGLELFAIYMPNDTTKISAGKLKIASYPKLEMKVKLVPMADFHINGIISEDILNEIYRPYYIHWQVTIDKVFNDTIWDTNEKGLQATGSEFYSMFTPEMRALNAAYQQQRGIDQESLYLFIFPNGGEEGGLMGDMPLKSRFGYIFKADGADPAKITQTVAHELGHGAFQLKHTFSDKYGIEKYSTDNLMDYPPEGGQAPGGTELVKYQWDVVHDPQNKLFNWMQDEEEGQQTSDYCNAPPLDKNIKGTSEAQLKTTEGYQIKTYGQSTVKVKCFQNWRWHFKRKTYPSCERTADNEGQWYKEEEYCNLDHVKHVAAAIYVLTDPFPEPEAKYPQSSIIGAKTKIGEFFHPDDNFEEFMAATGPCQDEIERIIGHLQFATGKVTEINLVFDFLTFVSPGVIYKGGKALVKGLISIANTRRIIAGIKGLTVAAVMYKAGGKTIQNADEIIEYSIKEGQEIIIESGGRKIGAISEGIINPVNFADEGGEVLLKRVVTTVDDAGKETVEVFEIISAKSGGLILNRTVAKGIKSMSSQIDNAISKLTNSAKFELGNTGKYLEVAGHHPLAKQAFKDNFTNLSKFKQYYDEAFSVSKKALDDAWKIGNKGVPQNLHGKITGNQNRLYSAWKKLNSGASLTIDDMISVEIQAMKEAGIPEDIATGWVIKALEKLKNQGVNRITNIPWNGINL